MEVFPLGEVSGMSKDGKRSSQVKKKGRDLAALALSLVPLLNLFLRILELTLKFLKRI